MTLLFPHLPFCGEETTLSFANRLALFHTGRTLRPFLKDIGIDATAFISGHAPEVTALAETAGVEPDVLMANTVRIGQGYAIFRGTRVSKNFLTPRPTRYCPACVDADGLGPAWRQRLIWGVRHVHRCHRHGLRLAMSPDGQAETLHGNLPLPDLSKRHAATGTMPDYLPWIDARLHGAPSENGWLDTQTLEQVLNASEILGAVLEHGHDVRVTRLTPEATEKATEIGFSIYREGPEAVSEALDTIRAASPATAVQAGPLAYYGRVFDWLDRRCNANDPGPIRDIVRDHIVRNFAIEPGVTLLGKEVTVRLAYTLKDLAATLKMDRRRLSRLLQKLGKVPEGATDLEAGSLIFDAAEIIPLIEAFQTAVPLADLPECLGASKRQAEALVRAGVLRALIPAATQGAVRNVVFPRECVDELLHRIGQFPAISEAPPGWHPIAFACQRGAGPFEHVFCAIMAGEIPAIRDQRKRGIGAILIEPSSAESQPITA